MKAINLILLCAIFSLSSLNAGEPAMDIFSSSPRSILYQSESGEWGVAPLCPQTVSSLGGPVFDISGNCERHGVLMRKGDIALYSPLLRKVFFRGSEESRVRVRSLFLSRGEQRTILQVKIWFESGDAKQKEKKLVLDTLAASGIPVKFELGEARIVLEITHGVDENEQDSVGIIGSIQHSLDGRSMVNLKINKQISFENESALAKQQDGSVISIRADRFPISDSWQRMDEDDAEREKFLQLISEELIQECKKE